MKTVKVRDVIIGEGMPKICVPIVEEETEAIIHRAEGLLDKHIDIVEWRADWFIGSDNWAEVERILCHLRDILKEVPLLFTFRTFSEGGHKDISPKEYGILLEKAILSGKIDAVDIEVFIKEDKLVDRIIKLAHKCGVVVMGSNHNFMKTYEMDTIVDRLVFMQDTGVDIAKIALMPNSKKDVLTLLEATSVMNEQYNRTPVVTMSMSEIGMISRLAGQFFGSAITFASDGCTSAPGQMPVEDVYQILTLIDGNLNKGEN